METTPAELGALADRLRSAGCVFAEDEAGLLLDAADTPARLEALVAARIDGLPLEQVLGWTAFCGLRIAVEPGVFVPRQRTALVVDEAAALCRSGSLVVDLCCGSGAVGAALLARAPGVVLHAADLDPVAVRCARRNLPSARVHRGDLFAALPGTLRGQVDVLTCNAPYVPTAAVALMPPEAREHEPRGTLDGGEDGLAVLRRVLAETADWLAGGGALVAEVGEAQAEAAVALAEDGGLSPRVVTRPDVGATALVATAGPSGAANRPFG